MVIHGAVRTKRGKVRRTNEDAFGFFPDLQLYMVADGLGGHAGGEIASTLTVATMRRCLQAAQVREEQELVFPAPSAEPPLQRGWKLFSAVECANARVFEESCRQPGLTGMGTTVTALYFDNPYDFVTIGHVGDTRAYRIRAGVLERLTEDHSLGQQLVQTGKLDKCELAAFPYRRLLTQAVGIRPIVYPEVRVEALKSGDIFLICSNGVHQEVGEEEVLEAVRDAGEDLQQVCDWLVDAANAQGGRDDETVLALSYNKREDELCGIKLSLPT